MMRLRIYWNLALGLIAAGLGACSDPNEPPEQRPPSELQIIRLPANHPPFFNDSVAFYAKKGRDADGFIYFKKPNGERGDKFAGLKIKAGSLLVRPDGTSIADGDSVLIVMKLADANQLLVEMRPSGLTFSAAEPAELKVEYEETEGDLDGDGDVDDRDEAIEQQLSIWRQENPGAAFIKVGTVKTEGLRELKGTLTSFSRFAVAY